MFISLTLNQSLTVINSVQTTQSHYAHHIPLTIQFLISRQISPLLRMKRTDPIYAVKLPSGSSKRSNQLFRLLLFCQLSEILLWIRFLLSLYINILTTASLLDGQKMGRKICSKYVQKVKAYI